jgi:putative oxidoreductase
MEIPMKAMSSNAVRVPGVPGWRGASVDAIQAILEFSGRVFLSVLFLVSGLSKIGTYAETAAYMSASGVPGMLLPLVMALEVFGAIFLIFGFKTRITAFLLAGFTLATALLFHNAAADPAQMTMFLKNVSIAGGFLLLAANGAGPWSLDRTLGRQGS